MGCGGSRDVVVEIPNENRRLSLPLIKNDQQTNQEGHVFSRPGSGPVKSVKTRPSSGGTVAPCPTPGDGASHNNQWISDELRKGSAVSKQSGDSGICIESKSSLPPSNTLLPDASKLTNGSGAQNQSGGPMVPRLASDEILSQLNEMGIVPKTSRCGSSLAFNIDLDNGEGDVRCSSRNSVPKGLRVGTSDRALPPLPPSRLTRLDSLPPLPTSLDKLQEKQQRAEERRKNKQKKVRLRAEQLRQRRVSEAEMGEKEDELKEKVSAEIEKKLLLNEANKEKLRQQQLEKKLRNEERLRRVKLNKERILSESQTFEPGDLKEGLEVDVNKSNDSTRDENEDVF